MVVFRKGATLRPIITILPPGFSQWDLNTRHSFNLKSVVLEPGFGVENLFDKVDDRPWNSNYSTLIPVVRFMSVCL